MPQCPACHADVDPTFKFCRQCGAAVAGDAPGARAGSAPRENVATQAPSRPTTLAPRRRRPARWIVPLGVALLVLGAGGYYFRASLPFASASKPSVRAEQHLNQGLTYASMKDYDNAIQEFTRAIDLHGGYAEAYANRGVAYLQQRKFNKALDDLRRAEGLSPRDRMIHYNLAATFSLQNQRDRALDALDRALALGFNDYDALRTDPDLANVRRDGEFRKVLEKHKVFLR